MTLLSTIRVHSGRVVSLDIDTVQFPNGNQGQLEMLRHPGASAVVPFLDDPDDADPRILMIHQFRHATGGWLWEIPAGRRQGDEPPEETARRELKEETGCEAAQLERLTTIWTTPGFTDEQIHLYWAAGLRRGATAHEDDEVLALHEIRLSRVVQMVQSGTISDGKTATAVLLLALGREKIAGSRTRR
jgi:ADP-ribose pyrophosphatase